MHGRTEGERAELRRLADDDDERAEELAEDQPGYQVADEFRQPADLPTPIARG